MGTHIRIIQTLKRLQEENPNPQCLELGVDSDEVLMRKYFLNYRGGDPDHTRGLRLTDYGLATLCCFVKSHLITLPEGYKPLIRHVIFLDRHCAMPWHLKGNLLTLFETEMAFKAKLAGDLDLLASSLGTSHYRVL